MVKVGINGFGRIGRAVYRAAMGNLDIEIVAVNDLGDVATMAHLLKYDSVHGTLDAEVSCRGDEIIVNGKALKVVAQPDPAKLPWKELGVEIVIESTVPTVWFHLLMLADALIALGLGCFMYKKYNTKFLYYV